MRPNDRSWRPEVPRAPAPGWAWLLALLLVGLAAAGYAGAVLLAR